MAILFSRLVAFVECCVAASYLRALRVDRPEARDRLPAPRAEAARVQRVPGVCAKEIISQGSSVLLCYDAHIEKIG